MSDDAFDPGAHFVASSRYSDKDALICKQTALKAAIEFAGHAALTDPSLESPEYVLEVATTFHRWLLAEDDGNGGNGRP
jgi:hypothetical protein